MKFDFNDIVLQPAASSVIKSRKEVEILDNDKMLPIMTAPMDTVVNYENAKCFLEKKINLVFPRGVFVGGLGWNSWGLEDLEEVVAENIEDGGTLLHRGKICLDVANGHMKRVQDLTSSIKENFPDLSFIAGNVGSPEGFLLLAKAGAKYIRVGIGNGGGCLTTQQCGVGYPMGSLIRECFLLKKEKGLEAKIIADGGMKDYADIIKALALGADYVMLGSILNKALESCAPTFLAGKKLRVNPQGGFCKALYEAGVPVWKKFRGMSTKEVQREWGCKKTKTSEGIVTYRKVEYTLERWIENFSHYLRSAMSYLGAHDLREFREEVEFNIISEFAFRRFNK